jgi:hypothetical protein
MGAGAWTRARGRIAGACLGVLIGTVSARAELPSTCDFVGPFSGSDELAFDDTHREARAFLRTNPAANSDEAKRWLEALSRSVEAARTQLPTDSSTRNAIEVDHARLTMISLWRPRTDAEDQDWSNALNTLIVSMQGAAGKVYAPQLPGPSIEGIRQSFRAHGPDIRQVAAIGALTWFMGATDPEFEAAARLMAEIAPLTGNARADFKAKAMLLRLYATQPVTPEAVQLATTMLPVAQERLLRARADAEAGVFPYDPGRCWTEDRVVEAINEILKTEVSRTELEQNYRLEALEVVTFGELETDFAGASEPYLKLAALRAIDDGEYRNLMRYFGRINTFSEDGTTDTGEATPSRSEVDMALSAGLIFDSMAMPDLSRQFMRDAKRWSAEGAPPRLRFDTLLGSLRLEWNSGGGNIDQALAEAQAIVTASRSAIPPIQRIQLATIEAEIYDSRLDDGRAAEALRRAVETALDEVGDTFDARNVTEEFDADLSRLVSDHLRGRFCQSCAEQLAPTVARYWRAAVAYDVAAIERGQSDSEISKAMTVLLSVSDVPVAAELRPEVESELDRIAAFADAAVRKSAAAKKIMAGIKAADRRAMLVAANMFPEPMAMAGMDEEMEIVLNILADRDLVRKRKRLAPIVALIAEDASQFGGDTGVFPRLDEYARTLGDLGLALSARVVTESVARLAEPDHGIEYWPEPDTAGRMQLAKVLGPAYARLARHALEDKNWTLADSLLDQAESLMFGRLQREWQIGNEQVTSLYRSLQPGLRLAAQLRVFLALNKDAARKLPDARDAAFKSLQFAMLGDTSVATQQAIRNRIRDDDGLRAALEARDIAVANLAEMEALELLAPSKMPWVVEARKAEATVAIESAASVIANRLTISEDYAALSPLTIAETAAGLQPDEALAVLHAGSNLVFGLIVRPDREPTVFTSKVGLAALTEQVAQLRREASSFGTIDLGNASLLYNTLLKPAESALEGVSHLMVVGDGPLPGLPWALLTTEPTDRIAAGPAAKDVNRGAKSLATSETAGVTNWAEIPLLIRKFPVSLSPNVRAVVAQRSALAASRATRPFFGIGNPALS